MDCSRKWLVDFSSGKAQLFFFDRFINMGAVGVKINKSILEEESSFKVLG